MSKEKQASLDDILAAINGTNYLLALLLKQKGFAAAAAPFLQQVNENER
jgi:hypothetical protein